MKFKCFVFLLRCKNLLLRVNFKFNIQILILSTFIIVFLNFSVSAFIVY